MSAQPLTETERRVLAEVEARRESLIEFLSQIVSVPSVNPWFADAPNPSREEEVQRLIEARLKALGATIDWWEPDADQLASYQGHPGYYAGRQFRHRPNLAGTLKGTGGGRSLLLFGHVDVVSAGSGWKRDPFTLVRENGRLVGRGTADMKGGMAAMMIALEAVLAAGVRPAGDIVYGSVVDEEAGGMGTLAFVDRGHRADACIMAEPTALSVAPLCRGILWGKLTIRGRSGHIEMPQADWREGGAVDAIGLARLYMDHFDRLNADWGQRKRHPLLPVPCKLLVAQIAAGEYPTAYANSAELVFNAQYLPAERDEYGLGSRVKAEIGDFVARVAATDPWLAAHPPQIEWLVDADCAETPADHPFVTVMTEAVRDIGRDPVLQGQSSHTDMGWLTRSGAATVNIGPGEPGVAHQDNEFIPEEELVEAAKSFALAILRWSGVPAPTPTLPAV